ncbi:MAG: xanthine dehydrogenase family protein molybdopterin-binding subunit [bacterium]
MIGVRLQRAEDEALVRGQGRFTADLHPAGCLHAVFYRSEQARVRLTRLETSRARKRPGVRAVFTGEDLSGMRLPQINPVLPQVEYVPPELLPCREIGAVGTPIALIVAEQLPIACDALAEIDARFDDADMQPRHHAQGEWHTEGFELACAEAKHTVSLEVQTPLLAPCSLEPRSVVAEYLPEEKLRVTLGTQSPHRNAKVLAEVLGLNPEQVHLVAPNVGGSFGMKASLYPEDYLIAWAAWRLRASVRWEATRLEEMLSGSHGRGGRLQGTLALNSEGRFLALQAQVEAPLGTWLPYSALVPAWNAGRILPGPYRVDAVHVTTQAKERPTAPVGIYRGAGRPEAALLMERLVEKAAQVCGMDALELRRINLHRSSDFPIARATGVVLDSGNYEEALERMRQASAELRGWRDLQRESGRLAGVGLSLFIEPSGQGWEQAEVCLLSDGTFEAATGSTDQGQGRSTAFSQIVAAVLNVPAEQVRVMHGDTQTAPEGIGALASRSTPIGGTALFQAASQLLEQASSEVARWEGVPVHRIRCAKEGLVCDQKVLTWPELAMRLKRSGAPRVLSARARFEAPGEAWGFGGCAVSVQIDSETGEVLPHQVIFLDDSGVVVNPMLQEGQILGGLVQGLGEGLMEEMHYDEQHQPLTTSFMSYALPRADNVPQLRLLHMATPSPWNPLGTKGVGEAGTIGLPPALSNAVHDALAPLKIENLNMPFTSERIWRSIQKARTRELGQ